MAYWIVITTYMQCFTKSGSEYRGRGVGVSLQKHFLDVSCGEKDPYFVYDMYQISEEALMKAL